MSPREWPDDVFVPPGFEFAGTNQPDAGFPPPPRPAHPSGPLPTQPSGPLRTYPATHPAGAEWARLLRSLLPQPVKS